MAAISVLQCWLSSSWATVYVSRVILFVFYVNQKKSSTEEEVDVHVTFNFHIATIYFFRPYQYPVQGGQMAYYPYVSLFLE